MKLKSHQIEILSKYFSDISKIIFAATVIGFIVPAKDQIVSIPVFIAGTVTTLASVVVSIKLSKYT